MKHYIDYLFIFLIFTFVFSGCQSAMSVFDKSGTQYERGLQHTRVKVLISDNSTKAIINISYLNSIDSAKWDNGYQNFLVGIYISDKNQNFINGGEYTLTMNGIKYLTYTVLNKKQKIFNNIPLKNHWAKYYILKFPNDDKAKTLVLKYKHTTFGEITLSFEKE